MTDFLLQHPTDGTLFLHNSILTDDKPQWVPYGKADVVGSTDCPWAHTNGHLGVWTTRRKAYERLVRQGVITPGKPTPGTSRRMGYWGKGEST